MKKKAEPPKKAKAPANPMKGAFKTGVQGKVWGKQYNDWLPSLMLNPVRT